MSLFERHPVLGEMPPFLNFLILPEAEQRGATEHMTSGLGELWGAVCSFKDALGLFDFCDCEKPEENEWKLIAARDGAWSISNLGFAMQYFRGSCGAYPTLNALIDHDRLRTAQKIYEASFPHFPLIRHALAHSPEATMNQQKRDEHYYRGPFQSDGEIIKGNETRMTIKHSLRSRVYQTTFSGQLLSYEISNKTLSKLAQIKDRFFSGFQLIEEKSTQTPHFKSS